MPTYEFECTECGSVNVEQFKMAERPDHIKCACGSRANYIISMPNRPFKEALLDGTKREGWSQLKEASKLNKELRLQKDPKEKARVQELIKQTGVRVQK